MPLRPDGLAQVNAAYRAMAEFYRPMAPSDGFGNLLVPFEELDLDAEASEYEQRWTREEDAGSYHAGCPNRPDRPALIFTVEAARCICGQDKNSARRLLSMALEALG